MKTKHLTIVFALGLLVILGGAVILVSLGTTPLQAAVKFDPNFIDWDSPAPPYWEAYVRAGEGSDFPARDIDCDTVMFEGSVPAKQGESYIYKGACVVKFDGQAVLNIIDARIAHMGVPPDATTKTPIRYDFTVTGKLLDGTDFMGTGWIKVRFPYGLPPPPQPPP